MNSLIQSPVIFDEEQHTYLYNGQYLSGITSIIKKYLFPDMYSNVSQAVLNRAAERGSRIHSIIQMWTVGFLSDDEKEELRPFFDEWVKLHFDCLQSEYLVSDNQSIASSIDLVCEEPESGGIYLLDIKTTAVLHVEYLQWQLSIYAYLFERQNPTLKVAGLKGVHIRDGKCSIVDIERIEDAYVEQLLDAYRSGAETFSNPLYVIPDGLNDLLDAYIDIESKVFEINKLLELYASRETELKEAITKLLKESNLSKAESSVAKVSILADSSRTSFDIKKFRESELYKASPDTYDEFIRTSIIKGRTNIVLK